VLNVIVNQPVLNNANAVVAEIEQELDNLGTVNVETHLSLISIIGDGFCNNPLLIQKLLAYLADYPVRNLMIGTSDHLINWLIPGEFEETMIIDVHRLLFEDKTLNNTSSEYDLSVAS
jgi:aspartokinase